MNFELLNRIHQIHQDLAVCKEVGDGDSVEILRVYENGKVNHELLKDIHELYYNGYLYLHRYCQVFGYSRPKAFTNVFKKNNLPTLSQKQIREVYNDEISTRTKNTNLERYGHSSPLESPGIREKIKTTNIGRYGVENPFASPVIRDKIKQTNLIKYGFENPGQSPAIRDKIESTNLERYGTVSPLGSAIIQEKIKSMKLEIWERVKKTNLERYGYTNPIQNPTVREKVKKTNLERYGYTNPIQNPTVREKVNKTNLERYGSISPFGSKETQYKIKQTNLGRYGHEYATQDTLIFEKIKQTNLERYGFENPSQSPIIKEKIKATRKSNDRRYAKLLDLVYLEPDKATGFVVENYTNHSKVLKRYGLYQENVSTPEAAIREILEKHKIEYWFRHRPKFMDGKELDFFIPSSNNPVTGNPGKPVAIEVNGLYWHSYPKKDKYYHQDKHLRCRSEGIQLLSFTEDQILDRLEIIESMILHKLGLTPYRLYAKNCDIRELNTQQAKDFLEKNHLHGFSNASVYLGLEYNGKLVHVMSFGNNRFKKSDHPELIRSASLRFHSVAGGFQRLLKYYKRSHGVDLVESYVDFNISNGQSYELVSKDLGDLPVRDNLTEPDLWFVYKGKRYRRQMFMKHNLHKIFSDFPKRPEDGYKEINASEYLRDRGVLEYYGAGNLKYLI